MSGAACDFVKELARELDSGNLELPSFPDVIVRVKELLEDPLYSVDKLVRLLGSEPTLAARILKLANSALNPARGGEIRDLRTAATRLGKLKIQNAAISVAMDQIVHSNFSGVLQRRVESFWKHSIRVAAIACTLARARTDINPDEALLVGLVHDIGRLYIFTRAKNYPELFSDDQTFEDVTLEWHTGIGRAILENWKFSTEQCVAVDEHEFVAREHSGPTDLTDILIVSNLFAHAETESEQAMINWHEVPACGRLEMADEGTIAETMKASSEEIRAICQELLG